MKVFVTGATGHIGSVLVKKLYERKDEITSLVLPGDDISYIQPYTEIVYGNILDESFLLCTIKDYDIVYHLAGMVEIGAGKKKKIYQINVQGTKNVILACQTNHIKRLVYTSSVHAIEELPNNQEMSEVAYFSPKLVKGHYAKSKAIATDLVLHQVDSDLEVVIVHPSGVIGPNDYKLSNITELFIDFMLGKLTAYMKGGYNFVDVRDVADGIISAGIKGKNRSCYILSGEEISVKELLDEIAVYTGKRKIKTRLAYWFILSMSYFAEIYYKLMHQKPLFTHYSVKVLKSNCHFSNQLAKKELGFDPRSIRVSIHDSIDFSKEFYLNVYKNKYTRKSLN
ncbi:MAG: NAD-dependent epimerase/dehydratase family protein [Candidatus Izemoplasmatales bacterium]